MNKENKVNKLVSSWNQRNVDDSKSNPSLFLFKRQHSPLRFKENTKIPIKSEKSSIASPSKIPVQLKLSFPSEIKDVVKVSSFIMPEWISMSPFYYKNLGPIINTHELIYPSAKDSNSVNSSSLFSINLKESPYLNELMNMIPLLHRPKEGNDILKFSSYSISGINVPSIVVLLKGMSLSNYFTQREVAFRRYIINFGESPIRHIIIPFTPNDPPLFDFSGSFEEIGERLQRKEIKYYDFIQAKGDVVIVEPMSYHIAESFGNTVFATWSRLELNRQIDMLAPILFNHRIPVFPCYIKFANEHLSEMTKDVRLNLSYLLEAHLLRTEHCNVRNKRYEPDSIDINFCKICHMEIFNLYYNINGSFCCHGCYDALKPNLNEINIMPSSFYFKYDSFELVNLINRLRGNQQLPNEYFIKYFKRKDKMRDYGSFSYYYPDINDIDEVSKVSPNLVWLVYNSEPTEEDIKAIFDYEKQTGIDYIDFESIFEYNPRFPISEEDKKEGNLIDSKPKLS